MGNRIYISGAITDCPDYAERFCNAEEKLKQQGFEVVNPVLVNGILTPSKTTYEEYMKVDICLLDLCDTIYMLEGWQQSKGANREYGYALAKGYKIIYENQEIRKMNDKAIQEDNKVDNGSRR